LHFAKPCPRLLKILGLCRVRPMTGYRRERSAHVSGKIEFSQAGPARDSNDQCRLSSDCGSGNWKLLTLGCVLLAASCNKREPSVPKAETPTGFDSSAGVGAPAQHRSLAEQSRPCSLAFSKLDWNAVSAEVGTTPPARYTLQLWNYGPAKLGERQPGRVWLKGIVAQRVTLSPSGTYRSEARFVDSVANRPVERKVVTSGRYMRSSAGVERPFIVFTGPDGACTALQVSDDGNTLTGPQLPPRHQRGTGAYITHIYRR